MGMGLSRHRAAVVAALLLFVVAPARADGPVYATTSLPAVGGSCSASPPIVDQSNHRIYVCESSLWKVRDLPVCNASPPTSPACASNLHAACGYWASTTPEIWMCNSSNTWTKVTGSAGGAPTTATYITQTADGTLSAEQALSALGTGLMKNTTTTGVVSIYGGATCTNQFIRSLDASAAPTCNAVNLGLDITGTLPLANITDSGTAGLVMTSGGSGGDPSWTSAGAGDVTDVGSCSGSACFKSGTYATTGTQDAQVLCWTDSEGDDQFCIDSSATALASDFNVAPPLSGTRLCAAGDGGCGQYAAGLDSNQTNTQPYVWRDAGNGRIWFNANEDSDNTANQEFGIDYNSGPSTIFYYANGSCTGSCSSSGGSSRAYCYNSGYLYWCDLSGSGNWVQLNAAKSLAGTDDDVDGTMENEVESTFVNKNTASPESFLFDADDNGFADFEIVRTTAGNSGIRLLDGYGFIQFGVGAKLKFKLCAPSYTNWFFFDEDDDGTYDAADDFCFGVGGYDYNCDCAADAPVIGSSGDVIFNYAGNLIGDSGFQFDLLSGVLTVGSVEAGTVDVGSDGTADLEVDGSGNVTLNGATGAGKWIWTGSLGDCDGDGSALGYDLTTGMPVCGDDDSGDEVTVDGSATTTPNFDDGGDINFAYSSPNITATVKADSVALGTDTTGNYAGSASEGGAATTALALDANPSDCSTGTVATTIAASGNLTCKNETLGAFTFSFSNLPASGTSNMRVGVYGDGFVRWYTPYAITLTGMVCYVNAAKTGGTLAVTVLNAGSSTDITRDTSTAWAASTPYSDTSCSSNCNVSADSYVNMQAVTASTFAPTTADLQCQVFYVMQ
jgi:hypothetical protein